MNMQKREAGILLPLSALPSPYGIGCLSREAYAFAELLAESGQRVWQILPLTPTSLGDSPYQSPSAFALNPYLIDLCGLIDDGLLSGEECEEALGSCGADRVDYGRQYERRIPLLRLAYRRFRGQDGSDYRSFSEKNRDWLEDYALFMAIKDRCGGASHRDWDRKWRERDPQAMEECGIALAESVEFYRFLQYRAAEEWERFHAYVKGLGIRIMGDLPLYVSEDSADLWAHPELFCLDREGLPERVAGCPPDDFSPDGQRWGNPLYRWEEHRRSDYAWWVSRLSHAFSLYDLVRIDHFRGFDAYYSIPAEAKTAREGRWERGIGNEMFRVAEEILGKRDLVAEDLGFETDSLRKLLEDCGFPGMKILQFGFGGKEGDFSSSDLPHNYPAHCVAYTGTHDNATLFEWLTSLSEEGEGKVREYLWNFHAPREALGEALIASLMRSPAELCVVPLQDYLGLGAEARMNTPAREAGNWQWRVPSSALSAELKNKILRLTCLGGRNPRSV